MPKSCLNRNRAKWPVAPTQPSLEKRKTPAVVSEERTYDRQETDKPSSSKIEMKIKPGPEVKTLTIFIHHLKISSIAYQAERNKGSGDWRWPEKYCIGMKALLHNLNHQYRKSICRNRSIASAKHNTSAINWRRIPGMRVNENTNNIHRHRVAYQQ